MLQTTIKVYANCLRPDIEYKTLSITYETTCREVVQNLLNKYRMRHRDPRLFYLIMEVTVRRANVRTVLPLDEDARPAVLQSCHPRGDSRYVCSPSTFVPDFRPFWFRSAARRNFRARDYKHVPWTTERELSTTTDVLRVAHQYNSPTQMVAWVAARFARNVNTAIRLPNRMEFMIFYGGLGRKRYWDLRRARGRF